MKKLPPKRLKYLDVLIFLFLVLGNAGFGQQITIDSTDADQPVFKAFPITEKNGNAQDLLKIFMVQENGESKTALLGAYSRISDTIYFKPQFKMGAGLLFNAYCYDKNNIAVKKAYHTKRIYSTGLDSANVTCIYPRASVIPKNILTFYVAFSEPMVEDESAFHAVNLYDENGQIVPHVWHNKSRWITDKIMILMIHPGRVKNGISYFAHLGALFTTGKKYRLEITGGLKPQNPNSELIPFIKNFEIAAPFSTIPKIKVRKFVFPKKHTMEKLKIVFSKPMDFYSLQNGISVSVLGSNVIIDGKIEPGANDLEWYFTPSEKWSEEKYTVSFNKYVTDLSGNTLIKSFETKKIKKSYSDMIVKKINFSIH